MITRDSKDTPAIQLCDLLLGAVMDAWVQKASSRYKLALKDWIAEHLGWDDLSSDTFKTERKFNIWHFYDRRRGKRPVPTRKVRLRYPPR